jgi:hypothetical protein
MMLKRQQDWRSLSYREKTQKTEGGCFFLYNSSSSTSAPYSRYYIESALPDGEGSLQFCTIERACRQTQIEIDYELTVRIVTKVHKRAQLYPIGVVLAQSEVLSG